MVSLNHTLAHPTLECSLRGKSTNTSVQFRNLKYARIPARYHDSVAEDGLKRGNDGIFDASRFGASCPQKRGAQAWDLTLLGKVDMSCEEGQGETEKMDEFECLSVNVSVPKIAIENNTKSGGLGLPVFAWVHGGGLSMGANSWPQYDLQKFVDRSVDIGKPVIAVAMNYRIGLFGFAAHEEMDAVGNMGFKDQVLAFRWIKKHIAGFGGDPSNIVAAAESAGAISLSMLLCANIGTEGLFERVILMSGEATLRKPRKKWWHEQMYNDQAKMLNIEATDKARLKTILRDTDAEALAQQLPLASHYCGYIDRKWLKQDITPNLLANGQRIEHKPTWCKEFVIGDTAHDGTVLKARILDHPQVLQRLKVSCARHLTKSEAQRLLAAYKLDGNLSPDQERNTLRCLASELRFYDPMRRAYRGWKTSEPPRSAFRYHFHIPNPFEGGFKDIVSHELDVAFVLQNLNDKLDQQHRQVARDMADHFIRYIHGKPWAAPGKIIVFANEGVLEVNEQEYDKKYRDGRGAVLDTIDGDKLWKVAEMWQGVRSEDDELSSSMKL
jgi:carboxylesterase type B